MIDYNSAMLKSITIVLLLTSTLVAEEDGFRPMFNGKNFDGWVAVNTAPSTWTVKDNMIICSGKPIGEMRTDRMYQNFIMEVEWRHMKRGGNAGIFVWADDITARGQPFHRGVEVQVLENGYGNGGGHTVHGDIFPIHGARMKPINGRGGGRAFPTEHRSKPSPQWNHYRIECNDGSISLAVNGKVVTRGTDASPRKGYICIESEGGIVHYRNMRIKVLPNTPVEDKDVAIANRGYRCLYTGVDLSGWKTAKANESWHSRDWTFIFDGKTKAPDRSIQTTTSFGDIGFIFDVRLHPDSTKAQVLLRGSTNAAITVELGAKHTPKPKRWNRFEGTIKGNVLSLSVNGRSVIDNQKLKDVPATGPISIVPTSRIDFANVYVRQLKK